MKVAIIGSRSRHIANLEDYLPQGITEIVTGGAKGIDSDAMEYAKKYNIPLTVFLPQFERYGRGAPIVRNREMMAYADRVIALWDGVSKGTASGIQEVERLGKAVEIVYIT